MNHRITRHNILQCLFIITLLFSFNLSIQAAVPDNIDYQGYLTDSGGAPINGAVSVQFSIYNVDLGGIALWTDTQVVNVTNGLFSVKLSGPFPVGLFDTPLWLGVNVASDGEMTPRAEFSSAAFAHKADDADSVGGVGVGSLATSADLSAHTSDTGNPHSVTAVQTGAASSASFALHAADPNAHHTKTTSFVDLTDLASDLQIPAAITRDSEVMPTVLANDGPGSTLNADLLDGLNSTAFMSAGTDDWVNVTGDTMTGNLNVLARIGIGTAAPVYGLDVRGGLSTYLGYFFNDNNLSGSAHGVYARGDAFDTSTGGGYGAYIYGRGGSTGGVAYGSRNLALAYGASNAYGVYSNATSGTTTGREYAFYGLGDGYISNSLGVGTSTPSASMHVSSASGNPARIESTGADSWISYYTSGGYIGYSGAFTGTTSMDFGTGAGNLTGDTHLVTNATPRLTVDASGQVGVGTTIPNSRLHVNGDGVDPSLRVQVSGGTRLIVAANTNVGIGGNLTVPSTKLQVVGGTDASFLNGSGYAMIGYETGANIVMDNNEIIARNNGLPSKLFLNNGGTHVVVPGLEITGGADLVEPFDVSNDDEILPGMVMAIDPDKPGQLRLADSEYDRTVAGIVSGANGINPGLSMSQQGSVADGSKPIALTGRLFALADASYGDIQPGDLLTTSQTPGHVMKVTDYSKAQGAIIGKAMTPLKDGKGFVLVLVSLQ